MYTPIQQKLPRFPFGKRLGLKPRAGGKRIGATQAFLRCEKKQGRQQLEKKKTLVDEKKKVATAQVTGQVNTHQPKRVGSVVLQ